MFRRIFTRNGIILISVPLSGGLMWILHFILEFSTLRKLTPSAELFQPAFILFHLAAVPFGCLFYISTSSRWNPYKAFVPSLTLLTATLIGMVWLPYIDLGYTGYYALSTIFISFLILLTFAGFLNGTILSITMITAFPSFDNPEYNGRFYFAATAFLCPIVIAAAWLDELNNPLFYSIYLLLIFLAIAVCFTLGHEQLNEHPPRCSNIRALLRQTEVWPSILLLFFVGFFFTNTYFAAVILLDYTNLLGFLNMFVMILFCTCLVATVPSGILFDKLGRRWSLLIGFYLQAIAFLLLSFFPPAQNPLMIEVIFPILIAFGFTISTFGSLLFSLELAPSGFLRVHQGISWALFGVGMTVGAATDIFLYSLITSSPAYLPLVLVFALFTATIIVLQLKETLPSRGELEWKHKIEHLLVLSKGGLPLYSERLSKSPAPETTADEMLVGGALTGITELVKEISQRAGKLKVIQQEGYCILLEEGREVIVAVMALEELGIIRSKTQDFLEEFQRFFGELVTEWEGNPKVFSPTKEIVKEYFH